MPVQHSNEFKQSFLGDAVLDPGGNIEVTADKIVAAKQVIVNLLKASYNEWGYGLWGANLDEFIGQHNSRETASNMEERIRTVIGRQDIIPIALVDIRILPITDSSVSIFISVGATTIIGSMVFSYRNGFELVE